MSSPSGPYSKLWLQGNPTVRCFAHPFGCMHTLRHLLEEGGGDFLSFSGKIKATPTESVRTGCKVLTLRTACTCFSACCSGQLMHRACAARLSCGVLPLCALFPPLSHSHHIIHSTDSTSSKNLSIHSTVCLGPRAISWAGLQAAQNERPSRCRLGHHLEEG